MKLVGWLAAWITVIDISNVDLVAASGVKYSLNQGKQTKVSAEDIYAFLDRTQAVLT